MRVATFNVHEWEDRRRRSTAQETIELLRELRCDAVVLQEVPEYSGTLERVAGELEMYHAFAPASFLGNALLSVAEPTSFEVVTIACGYAEVRSAFVATLPWEGGTFTLIGTHLDHRSEHHRLRQTDQLLLAMDGLVDGGLGLVAGDFNALCLSDYDTETLERIRAMRVRSAWEPPLGDVTGRLAARGFIDLWQQARAAGPERLSGVFNDATTYGAAATCWAGTRIDYIWATGPFNSHARLVGCDRVPTEVSDHVPVVAEIAPGG